MVNRLGDANSRFDAFYFRGFSQATIVGIRIRNCQCFHRFPGQIPEKLRYYMIFYDFSRFFANAIVGIRIREIIYFLT